MGGLCSIVGSLQLKAGVKEVLLLLEPLLISSGIYSSSALAEPSGVFA